MCIYHTQFFQPDNPTLVIPNNQKYKFGFLVFVWWHFDVKQNAQPRWITTRSVYFFPRVWSTLVGTEQVFISSSMRSCIRSLH